MRRRPELAPRTAVDDGGAADKAAALRLTPVSRETEQRLTLYVERLRRWQAIKNLVGPSTLQHVWTRHIADSAQLRALAPEARRWVDLGSGAGFPGLVIAILLADEAGARVDLVESNNRKCAFLREVARDTGAPATVHDGRIEDVLPRLPPGIEVVTSRALAPIPALIDLAAPLLDAGATGLFLGGEGGGEGAIPATEGWDVSLCPSKTHDAGRIVMVRRSASWNSPAENQRAERPSEC